MAHVISISNHKGGVGKTTTAMNVAACLAKKGYRTLLVDLDAQMNATLLLRIPVEAVIAGNSYDMIHGQSCTPYHLQAGYDAIGGHRHLATFEIEAVQQEHKYSILKNALQQFTGSYDYIVLDTAPALGAAAFNAAVAADSVIIPVQAEYMAVQGMNSLINVLDATRNNLNATLQLCGVLITQYDNRRILCQQMAAYLQRTYGADVFNTKIRDNVAIVEAGAKGMSVFDYAPRSHGAEDYEAMTEEMLQRIAQYKEHK